jgi:HKD family nuclease
MAKPSLLLQGLRKDNDHETALKALLNLRSNRIIISVAFVRESGVKPLAAALKRNSTRTNVYVGIRNGVTSAQGLLELLRTGVRVIVVDTGSLSNLFHPKLYLAVQVSSATLIVGSANLTYAGLNENIEASTVLVINRKDTVDEQFVRTMIDSFDSLLIQHPNHVFPLRHKRDVIALLKQGRLEDEEIAPPPRGSKLRDSKRRDTLPRMSLFRRERPSAEKKALRRQFLRKRAADWVQVWTSKGLTERDLNVPTGVTTHSTGSMLFKKGNLKDIDQRTYFREVVFSGLSWSSDPRPNLRHLERTQAQFDIVVKGINYGAYSLKLTHNSRKNSRAYEQLNAMTQVHWGDARKIVAMRDLLGRELRLYRKGTETPQFLIEID